jgi:hypothetical protein
MFALKVETAYFVVFSNLKNVFEENVYQEVSPIGPEDHVSVEVDGLGILFGDLLAAPRQLLSLFLGKLLHYFLLLAENR